MSSEVSFEVFFICVIFPKIYNLTILYASRCRKSSVHTDKLKIKGNHFQFVFPNYPRSEHLETDLFCMKHFLPKCAAQIE